MTETAIAANVHQTLDVHRGFAAQVTFQGELGQFVTDLFQIGVGQFLDLLVEGDAAGFADLAGAESACRVREVLEAKLAIILEEFGIDKTGDVLDSAQAGQIFDDLYVDAILNPEKTIAEIDAWLEGLPR